MISVVFQRLEAQEVSFLLYLHSDASHELANDIDQGIIMIKNRNLGRTLV